MRRHFFQGDVQSDAPQGVEVFGLRGSQRTLLSTAPVRKSGFGDCIDTEALFQGQLRRLQAMRVLPP